MTKHERVAFDRLDAAAETFVDCLERPDSRPLTPEEERDVKAKLREARCRREAEKRIDRAYTSEDPKDWLN